LSHQVLQAQEEERKRISRDLHDVIAQTLVGINVQLATLTKEAAGGPKGLDRASPARNKWWKNRWKSCISSPANCARRCWMISD
jgi:signal transduction histidine kinase